MMYDAYSQKVLKLAKIKNKILKYKILILSVTGALLAFLIFFLSTKGVVTSNVSFTSESTTGDITYGDDYSVSASAMWSGVSYEYRAEGEEEWTTIKPTLAGTYYARAVTAGLSGNKYSSEVQFVIHKRPITMSLKTTVIEYSKYPGLICENLDEKDQLDDNSVTFTFEDRSKSETNAVLNSYKIVNKKTGEDVTDNYEAEALEGTFTFKPHTITIKPETETVEYDGNSHTYTMALPTDNLGYDDVAYYETVALTQNGASVEEAKEIGSYTVNLSGIRIMGDGRETTGNYTVNTESGILIITKRSISLNLSVNVTYGEKIDTTAVKCNDVNSKLLSGHHLEVVASNNEVTSSTFFTSNNLYCHILDEENNIVDDLYDISYSYESCEIGKRNLEIELVPMEDGLTYDATEKTYSGFYKLISGSLYGNEGLSLSVIYKDASGNIISSPVDAGTYGIEYEGFDILGGSISNYSITCSNSITFDIGKAPITLMAMDMSAHTYNGEEVTYDSTSYDIISGSSYGNEISIAVTFKDEEKNAVAPVNAGTYSIYVTGHNESLNKNFDVTYSMDAAVLVINPEEINVTFKADNTEKYYSGEALAYEEGYTYTGTLYGNDTVSFDTSVYDENGISCTPVNAGSYTLNSTSIHFDGSYVNNYIFTINPAQMTILRLPVTLKAQEEEGMVYDTTSHSYESSYSYAGENKFIGTDTTGVNVNYLSTDGISYDSVSHADTYKAYIVSITNDDLYQNYDISFEDASETDVTFTISPYEFDITAKSATSTYTHSVMEYEADSYELSDSTKAPFGSDSFTVVTEVMDSKGNVVSPIDAGTYTLRIVSHEFTTGLESDYKINYHSATLTITPLHVTVKVTDYTRTYGNDDTYPTESGMFECLDGTSFLGTDTLKSITIDSLDSYRNANGFLDTGDYSIHMASYVFDGTKESNYEIEMSSDTATLTIVKRDIILSAEITEDYIYNGKTYAGTQASVYDMYLGTSSHETVDKISFTCEFTYKQNEEEATPLHAGTYDVYVSSYSSDLDKNFSVTISDVPATLNIIPRDVTIAPKAQTLTYTAHAAIYDLSWKYVSSTFVGIISNDTDKVILTEEVSGDNLLNGEAVFAGEYTLSITSFAFGDDSFESDYNVTYNTAKLTINKATIRVRMNEDVTVTYDGISHSYPDENLTIPFLEDEENTPRVLITYEYYNKSNTKTALSSAPTNAGSYTAKVNSVTHAEVSNLTDYEKLLLNNYDFSLTDEASITINKRPIILSPSEITATYYESYKSTSYYFDSVYNGDADTIGLVNSSYAYTSTLSFYDENGKEITPVNAGEYVTRASRDDVKLSGDQLSNYSITMADGTLSILKREIRIAPYQSDTAASFEYNGKEYEYDSSTCLVYDVYANKTNVSTCVDNTKVTDVEVEYYKDGVKLDGAPIDQGTYDIVITFAKVSDNFEITDYNYVSYSITIIPRTVHVSLYDLTFEYDAEEVILEGTDLDYKLHDDEYFVTRDGVTDSITITGYFINPNEFSMPMKNSNPCYAGSYYVTPMEWDFTGRSIYNYSIWIEASSLTITPRTLSISMNDEDDYVYDSSYHYYSKDVTITNKPDAEEATISFSFGYNEVPLKAGSYRAEILDVYATGSTDYDTTFSGNYTISYAKQSVTYEISRRSITIAPVETTEAYNGLVHTYDGTKYDISDGEVQGNDSLIIDVSFKSDDEEVVWSTDDDDAFDSKRDAGTVTTTITGFNISRTENGTTMDVSDSYDVTYLDSTFTITPEEVSISLAPIPSKVYDGTPLKAVIANSLTAYTMDGDVKNIPGIIVTSGTFYDDDSISPNINYEEGMNLGWYVTQREGRQNNAPVNAGNYIAYMYGYLLLNSVSGNYIVTLDTTAIDVVITPREIELQYVDSKAYYFTGSTLNLGRRTSYNTPSNAFVGDDSVSFTLDSYLNGEACELYHAATYTVKPNLDSIQMRTGTLSNYTFVALETTLVINPMQLMIRLNPSVTTKVYDGMGITFDCDKDYVLYNNDKEVSIPMTLAIGSYVKTTTLAHYGETLTIEDAVSAGEYKFIYQGYLIADDAYLASDYLITNPDAYADYTITSRAIYVFIPEASKIYDGNAYEYDATTVYDITDGSMVDGETLSLTLSFKNSKGKSSNSVKDVGEYTTSIGSFQIIKDGSFMDDGAYNYIVSADDSILIIAEKEIAIAPVDQENYFNGKNYSYPKATSVDDAETCYQILSGELATGDYVTFDVIYYVRGTDTETMAYEVGTYDVKIDLDTIKVYSDGKLMTSSNYSFTTDPMSVLTIKTLDLSLTITDGTHTYDGTSEYDAAPSFTTDETIPSDYEIELHYDYYDEANDVWYRYSNEEVPAHTGTYKVCYADSYSVYYKNKIVKDQQYFNVSVTNGTLDENPASLIISSRSITLTGKEYKEVYDATSKDISDCYTISNLIKNDKADVTVTIYKMEDDSTLTEVSEIKNVGLYIFEYEITSYSLSDASDYKITYKTLTSGYKGSYTVTSSPLSMRPTFEGSKDYDAEDVGVAFSDITIDSGLITGHVLTVTSFQYENMGWNEGTSNYNAGIVEAINYAGEYHITISGFTVLDENGNDVTSNYSYSALKNDYSVYTITPLEVIVKTGDYTGYYDTLEHSNTTDFSVYENPVLDEFMKAHNHVMEATIALADIPTIIFPGTVENELGVIIRDQTDPDNYVDVSHNYKITYEYGTLTILKRTIVVTTGSNVDYLSLSASKQNLRYETITDMDGNITDVKIYYGGASEYLSIPVYSYEDVTGDGLDCHDFESNGMMTISATRNQNTMINTVTDEPVDNIVPLSLTIPKAAYSERYSFDIEEVFDVYYGSAEEESFGKLQLSKETISVSAVNKTGTYSGASQDMSANTYYTVTKDYYVATGDSMTSVYGLTGVGESLVTSSYVTVYQYDDKDTAPDISKYTYSKNSVDFGDDEEHWTKMSSTSITDAGFYIIFLGEIHIENSDGESMDSNYTYSTECAYFMYTMKKLEVSIITGSTTDFYTGPDQKVTNASINFIVVTSTGNVEEDTYYGFTVSRDTSVPLCYATPSSGEVINEMTPVIKDSSGNIVTDNFIITTDFGTLLVEKHVRIDYGTTFTYGTQSWTYFIEEYCSSGAFEGTYIEANAWSANGYLGNVTPKIYITGIYYDSDFEHECTYPVNAGTYYFKVDTSKTILLVGGKDVTSDFLGMDEDGVYYITYCDSSDAEKTQVPSYSLGVYPATLSILPIGDLSATYDGTKHSYEALIGSDDPEDYFTWSYYEDEYSLTDSLGQIYHPYTTDTMYFDKSNVAYNGLGNFYIRVVTKYSERPDDPEWEISSLYMFNKYKDNIITKVYVYESLEDYKNQTNPVYVAYVDEVGTYHSEALKVYDAEGNVVWFPEGYSLPKTEEYFGANYEIYFSYDSIKTKFSTIYSNTKSKSNYCKTLTIFQRSIDVYTRGASKVYDGTPISYDTEDAYYFEDLSQLVSGDTYAVVEGSCKVSHGSKQNKLKFTFTSPTLGDVSSSYKINYTSEEVLEIIPLKLTIVAKSASLSRTDSLSCEEYYIDWAHSDITKADVEAGTYVIDDSEIFYTVGSLTYDESSASYKASNEVDGFIIYNASGSKVTKYFDITYVPGVLEVK